MKQILQSLKTGETQIEDIPCPVNTRGTLLIETSTTLVSAGTERMLLDFGKANLLGKIKRQPDKVKMVLNKIKTDGLSSTLEAVKAKLEQPIPLGYCNTGTVLEIGSDVNGFKRGDRVISNGAHAEVVRVPKNLCAKIPEKVSDEESSFTVIGSIALQGVRLAKPMLGECFAVIGLGIIGLITVQILRANGCRVLGVDFDETKLKLAESFGAETVNLGRSEDLFSYADSFSRGRGMDGVIITAATSSNEPLHQAATMCRQRGRVILVGVIGNEFSRADFYEKEITFQVSCSYGPGRYDDDYELKGIDYPVGFVRWTEQRNFEAVLDMMACGSLDVKPLISHRFNINDSIQAYDVLQNDKTALGILLNYPEATDAKEKITQTVVINNRCQQKVDEINVGFVGAGNYGARMLAPAFKNAGSNLLSVASSTGVSGKLLARKIGFSQAHTNEQLIYDDPSIDVVAIVTRHDMHASQVIKALEAGKHVFVEKPLALTLTELDDIYTAYQKSESQLLMIGFNRRFAPQVKTIKELLTRDDSPKSFIMTVNAGQIPSSHWTQDQLVGGGRIIGEACHFIDLLRFLAGSKIINWHVSGIACSTECPDTATILLDFSDGSSGTIHYLANGHKAFPKERLEVFQNGKILQLDNFRKLFGMGWQGFSKQSLRRQDKGQLECANTFINAIKAGQQSPIAFDELMEVSKVTIEIAEYLKQKYSK